MTWRPDWGHCRNVKDRSESKTETRHGSALNLYLLWLTVCSLRSIVQRHGSQVCRWRISPYTTQRPLSQLSRRKAIAFGNRQSGITPAIAGIIGIVVGTTSRTAPGMWGVPRVAPTAATTTCTRWAHDKTVRKLMSLEKD
jgi:hypothetical protein